MPCTYAKSHRRSVFASTTLAIGLAACMPVTKTSNETHAADTDAEPDGADSTSPSPSASPSFTPGRQPVAVTGANLADYADARVRCDYTDTAVTATYNAHCLVVTHDANGQEHTATGLAPGATLAWSMPQTVRGAMSFGNCAASNAQLGYECAVTVTDPTQLAEAAFGFQISNGQATRPESTTLLLPYAVGVAAGFIPNMPYSYAAQSADNLTGGSAGGPAVVGFQHFSFSAGIASFAFPNGICQRDNRLFFADRYSIYQVQNGLVSHYGGSGNPQNMANTSDKLRAYFAPNYLACNAGAVYVSSSSMARIFKLTDDGAVTVIGGNGSPTAASDGALAANSGIGDPRGLAVDAQGDVVFADFSSHRVRRITAAGIVQTVAGTGVAGYAGDGGQARLAMLTTPIGVAIAGDGSVVIADVDTATVRKVAPSGVITTLAGTGTQRYAATMLASRALAEPQQVGFDAQGNVYVSELYRGIKRIVSDGSLVQVVSAGADIAQSARQMRSDVDAAAAVGSVLPEAAIILQRPEFGIMAVDQDSGKLYAEGQQGVLSFVPNPAGVAAGSVSPMTIVVGSELAQAPDCAAPTDATRTRLVEAGGLAVASDNAIFVADWLSASANQMVVHKITQTATGTQAQAVYGCQSPASLAGFNPNPYGPPMNSLGSLVAGPDGALYLTAISQNRILKFAPGGTMTVVAGTGAAVSGADGALAATAAINAPTSLAVGRDGSLYFTEYPLVQATDPRSVGTKVRRISPQGILSTVAGTGAPGDSGEDQPATTALLRTNALAVAPDGRIFLADIFNAKIKMIDRQGVLHTIAGIDQSGAQPMNGAIPRAVPDASTDALQVALGAPSSIAISNDGTVYVVDAQLGQILQMRQNAAGGWGISVLFGVKRTSDCSTATVHGVAAAGQLAATVNSSLAVICEGAPKTVVVKDTCPQAGGDTRIVFSQTVGTYANIVEIVKPCGS